MTQTHKSECLCVCHTNEGYLSSHPNKMCPCYIPAQEPAGKEIFELDVNPESPRRIKRKWDSVIAPASGGEKEDTGWEDAKIEQLANHIGIMSKGAIGTFYREIYAAGKQAGREEAIKLLQDYADKKSI